MKKQRQKTPTSDVVKRFKAVHGERYDYSLVQYVCSKSKITIRCKVHGNFEQTPAHHLEGQGCYKCNGGGRQFDFEFIVEKLKVKAPFQIYDFSQAEYVNRHSKIKIICTVHKTYFYQSVDDLKRGFGCPMCKGKFPKGERTKTQVLKEMYGDKYDYLNTNFDEIKLADTIKFKCKEHGMHLMTLGNHIRYGCHD